MKQMTGDVMEMKQDNKEIKEYLKKANDKLKEVLLDCRETKLMLRTKEEVKGDKLADVVAQFSSP